MTGTVVCWELENIDQETRVKYQESEDISVHVVKEDVEASAIVPAIISKYIENKKDLTDKQKLELLGRAGQGLLQVVGIRRTLVTPPPVPFDAIRHRAETKSRPA
jgi:hypothetical protein